MHSTARAVRISSTQKIKKTFRTAMLLAAATSGFIGQNAATFGVYTATNTFTNAGADNLWANPANWSGGTVPTATDLVSLGIAASALTLPLSGAIAYGIQATSSITIAGPNPITLMSTDNAFNGTEAFALDATVATFIVNAPIILGDATTSTSSTQVAHFNNTIASRAVRIGTTSTVSPFAGTTWSVAIEGTQAMDIQGSVATPWTTQGPTIINGIARMSGAIFPHGSGKGNVQVNSTGQMLGSVNGGVYVMNGLDGSGIVGFQQGRAFWGIGDGNSSGNFSGTFNNGGANSSVIKMGSGTQTFSGVGNIYVGPTYLLGGTLAADNIAVAGTGSSVGRGDALVGSMVFDGGTLKFFGGGGTTNRLFTVGLGGGTIDSSGSGIVSFTSTSLTQTWDATWRTGTAVTVAVPGPGTINNLNSLAGLTVGMRSISLANGVGVDTGSTISAVNANDISLTNGATTGNTTTAPASNTGYHFNIFVSPTGSNRTLTLAGTNTGDNNLGVALQDSSLGGKLAVTKSGVGTWIVGGANTNSGPTTINGGTLKLGGAHGLNDSTNTTTVNSGGTLDVNGITHNTGKAITLNGGSLVNNSATPATIDTGAAASLTSGGTVSGAANTAGPTVSITGGGGTGATGTATMALLTIPVVNGGAGYTGSFGITLGAPPAGGVQATASAIRYNGIVTGIMITNPGAGYTSIPSISIVSGAGSGLVLGDAAMAVNALSLNGGTGYTSAPSVTLTSVGGAAPTAVGGVGLINVTAASSIGGAGDLSVNVPITGSGALTKNGAGTTTIKSLNLTNTLNVNAGKLVLASQSAPLASVAATVNGLVTTAGQLDVKNNAVIVKSTDTTDAARNAQWANVVAGQNNFDNNGQVTWDGNGIVSSTARTSNVGLGVDVYVVGVASNHDLAKLSADGGAVLPYDNTNPWLGTVSSVGADDILIRMTYAGDTNLDGTVTIDDYNNIDGTFSGLLATNYGWVSGDFDFNGVITIDDYNAIDTGFLYQGGQLTQGMIAQRTAMFGADYVTHLEQVAAGFASVPEPGTLGIAAAIAGFSLCRRIGRSKSR